VYDIDGSLLKKQGATIELISEISGCKFSKKDLRVVDGQFSTDLI
jgi:hypothetical protein